ncbi:hypothetical protein POTOM_039487 [Populus tomentosa]|uniref:MLO-like protein n=1 Tax=Populus tomentosa TaxID=118781 RepID=A0A8X7YMN0_POPTO|nr:hypothetical protein POTOM_039487 [Populus tomentosa]
MAGEGEAKTLEETPTWAVAAVCFFLILISIFIEHLLHLLAKVYINIYTQNLNLQYSEILDIQLRIILISIHRSGNINFPLCFWAHSISTRKGGSTSFKLCTRSKQPVANICIPKSAGETFLPCGGVDSSDWSEEEAKCAEQGQASLLSREGMRQLQYLIFVLASFHCISSIFTFGLGMAKVNFIFFLSLLTFDVFHDLLLNEKMGILGGRDKDTGLSICNRSQEVPAQSSNTIWEAASEILACFLGQFYGSVSKVDYLTLRHGFIMAHFDQDNSFDFQKYIRRALDKDFGVLVGISFWIWMFSISFIFFNAHKFYSHYWLPFIPLLMLLLVGTKLQAIITLMCLDSHDKSLVVEGTILVRPSDHFFWFGRPKLLLHFIQFILFQNSFQLAFFTWTWYKFGFRSCFHRRTEDIVITLGMGLSVHFLCGYVTLPLYALVTQMGSSMRTAVFTENVVEGLKRWRAKARQNLKISHSARPSLDASVDPSLSIDTSPSFSLSASYSIDPIRPLDRDHVTIEVIDASVDPSLSIDTSPSFSLSASYSIDPIRPLDRDHVTIEVIDEAKHNDEQPGEPKRNDSFEGFNVSNAAPAMEKQSARFINTWQL